MRLKVHTGTLSVTCNELMLTTRSRALLLFVGALVRQKRDWPNTPWIGIDALREALPSVHGKQMQRFVDALAEIRFPISYESKTRGRYCLDMPAEQVYFDVDDSALDAFMGVWKTAGALPIPIRQTQSSHSAYAPQLPSCPAAQHLMLEQNRTRWRMQAISSWFRWAGCCWPICNITTAT